MPPARLWLASIGRLERARRAGAPISVAGLVPFAKLGRLLRGVVVVSAGTI